MMKEQTSSWNSRKPLLTGLVVFFILAALTQYLALQKYLIDKEARRTEVLQEINSVKDRIKGSLGYGLSATKTLAFIIKKYGVPADFAHLGKEILESNKNIDAIELTREGLITHVYPLKGNEQALGYDILKDPLRRGQALRAIQTNELFFDGPFKFKQGGIGFVGRLPIFIENKFWGFSAVLIKLSTFLKAAGIDTLQNGVFIYQLSKVNLLTNKEEIFLHGNLMLDKSQSASIVVQDGEWKLCVMKKNNAAFFNVLVFSFFGIVLSFICGLFAWSISRQPEKLKELVNEKTLQLAESEKYFRTIIEKSADAILLLNKEGKIIYQTPSTEKISGYTFEEMKSITLMEIIHPDDKEGDSFVFNYLRGEPGVYLRRNTRIRHKNGQYIWLEGTFTNLLNDSAINAIVYNCHDITQRVESQERAALANRLYEVISRVNRVMVDVKNESDLFREACGIAVNYGKFKMAWIGIVDEASKIVMPIFASAEEDANCIQKIKSVNLADQGFNIGPTGRSIMEGKYIFCNDIKNDPVMKPWAKDALANGYNSLISLPVKKAGKIIGSFNLYSPVTGYFNANEISLLEEMTNDISFTLGNFENEKRIASERILSDSIINSLPGVFYLYEKAGKFIRWNRNFELVSGYTNQEVSEMHPLDFFEEDEKMLMKNKIENVFQKGEDDVEAFFLNKSKQKIPYYFNGYRVEFNNNDYLIGMGLDITVRKEIERELKESESKYRLLFNKSPIASWTLSIPSYTIIDVNDAAIKNYGYSREEFLGMNARKLRPAEDLVRFEEEVVSGEWAKQTSTGKWRHLKKDGEQIMVEVITYDFSHGNEQVRLVLANDVTDREKAEEAIKQSRSELRKLSNYLQTVREEERTGIAREIHDELGQQLTGLKMDSYWILKKLNSEDDSLRERLDGMISLIDDTIKTVRRIASQLRPGILDDLGLIAALEWQTQEFEKRTGVKANLVVAIHDFDPSDDLSTTIFRVYQEALTNITRYAVATKVEALIEENEGCINLSIKDNGIGFDVGEAKIKNSLGLLGMKERAILFGGELHVTSEIQKGTCITLKIPLLNIDKTHV